MREIILPWPEWKLGKLLGRGAFGEVYQAEREEFGNKIYSAIKIMRIPADQSDVDMLENSGIEARSYLEGMISDISNEIVLMQSLKGAPNIVGIEDYKILESEEELQWTIFIRMELLEDLNHYKKRHELSYEEIIHLGCDICNALNICRKMKIVHRDIKPSNIFISRFGDYKLGDFGISKHTEHTKSALSTQKGTISYMAPEIYKGEKYDHTVDIFSLGVVLFQLANNGRLPFYPPAGTNVLPGDVDLALSKRNSGEAFPDPANGGKELGDIIRKACHKDPSQRYLEPGQMRHDLQNLIKSDKSVWDEEDEEKTILLNPVKQDKQDVAQKKAEDLKTKKDKKSGNHYKWIIMSVIALLGVSAVSVTFLKLKNKSDPIVIETESETETELETETETESETESELDTETESETESGLETETEMESETESELDTESEIESKSAAAIETESETESELETETETESETESELEIETETESETESELETETEMESETESELETETETESETESELETETEAESGTETEMKKITESVQKNIRIKAHISIDGKEINVKIHNLTNSVISSVIFYEDTFSEPVSKLEDQHAIPDQAEISIQGRKDKLYQLEIVNAEDSTVLKYYNLAIDNYKKLNLYEDDGYTYVIYTLQEDKNEISMENYKTKTYDTGTTRYVLTGSGLNVRELPDSVSGTVISKLNLGDEVQVIGEAKGLTNGEVSDWYLVKLENQFGYISANEKYSTDSKEMADQKVAEAAQAAETQQYYESSSPAWGTGNPSSGGGNNNSSSGGGVIISSW